MALSAKCLKCGSLETEVKFGGTFSIVREMDTRGELKTTVEPDDYTVVLYASCGACDNVYDESEHEEGSPPFADLFEVN